MGIGCLGRAKAQGVKRNGLEAHGRQLGTQGACCSAHAVADAVDANSQGMEAHSHDLQASPPGPSRRTHQAPAAAPTRAPPDPAPGPVVKPSRAGPRAL